MAANMDSAGWPAHMMEDESWFPLRCSIAAIIMATVAYILRFYSRALQAAPWGWFDWLMIPGYVFTMAMSICGILAAQWGSGRHIEVLYSGSDADLDRWGLLTYYISAFLYVPAITFPRLSILCMFRKIFNDKYSRAGIWVVVAIMVARMVVGIPILFLQCDSLSDAWHIERVEQHCRPIIQHYTYGRIPNIVADVILLLLPLPSLWRLQLATDVKVGLIATFCLGSFGLVTAIIGFAEFFKGQSSSDISWVNGGMIGWSVLEPAVYFTSACMLTYKPLVRSFVRRTGNPSFQTQHSTYHSGSVAASSLRIPANPSLHSSKEIVRRSPIELPSSRWTYLTKNNTNASPSELQGDWSSHYTKSSQTLVHTAELAAQSETGKMSLLPPLPDERAMRTPPRSVRSVSSRCGECYGCFQGGRCDDADQGRTRYLDA